MKKLQNILYVTSEKSYLSLDGENIVVLNDEHEVGRVPLHNLEGIVAFGYKGTSPALMGACAEKNISLCYLTPQGKFLASVSGRIKGNVLLRRRQYEITMDEKASLEIAKCCILGKIYNCRQVVERAIRDHGMQVDTEKLRQVSLFLKNSINHVRESETKEQIRGYEGEAASIYFSVFDELILQQKTHFCFCGRTRRPPMDNVNALLSFVYTLLANQVGAALETNGLDPYMGVLHTERPGRASLALDMMEELRPIMADRFVLSLINKRMIGPKDFQRKENGAVLMKDEARKNILTEWQNRKRDTLEHPFLKEKLEWGIVPHAQAQLLARYLRGDMDAYPPFFWK